jgi:L-alanine-DL-glutamate epimerase-like enolase superfamily enzyme
VIGGDRIHGRGPTIDSIDVSTFVIPTDAPESDGTLEWDRTTLVVVEIAAGGVHGLGYTYTDRSAAVLVRETLARHLLDADAFAIPALNARMLQIIRNLGRPGSSRRRSRPSTPPSGTRRRACSRCRSPP